MLHRLYSWQLKSPVQCPACDMKQVPVREVRAMQLLGTGKCCADYFAAAPALCTCRTDCQRMVRSWNLAETLIIYAACLASLTSGNRRPSICSCVRPQSASRRYCSRGTERDRLTRAALDGIPCASRRATSSGLSRSVFSRIHHRIHCAP